MADERMLAGWVALGVIDETRAAELAAVADRYAVALTPHLAATLAGRKDDDPLVRQFVPSEAELVVSAEERSDPIGDGDHSPVKGIVHRYPDRVLLKPVHVCAVYCRFCFRRAMVGPGGEALTDAELEAALAYVAGQPEVWEVVLTGGDPLLLAPRRLAAISGALGGMEHVGVLRVHTRLPVADPAKVSDERIAALKAGGLTTWVAVHVNHADELSPPVRAALARLADAGIPLLAQTVLLRGVNDDAATLEALFRGLVQARVKPYYLHHGDLAPGTGHFRTGLAHGRALMDTLRGRVSGVCQPTYVLDIPGGHGKVPATAPWVEPDGDGWTVRDPWGGRHDYGHPVNGDKNAEKSPNKGED